MKGVIGFANEILDMEQELFYLRKEVDRLRGYEKKYLDEIQNGIQHGQKMIAGILDIAMVPGVMEAISKFNAAPEGEAVGAN